MGATILSPPSPGDSRLLSPSNGHEKFGGQPPTAPPAYSFTQPAATFLHGSPHATTVHMPSPAMVNNVTVKTSPTDRECCCSIRECLICGLFLILRTSHTRLRAAVELFDDWPRKMDNLALSVSKSITDFLEQNEKRFVNQHSQQEQHNQLLIDLQTKIEQLERKCDELVDENKSLRSEVDTLKQRDESTSKDIITTKSDLEKMQKQVMECSEWTKLMAALTQQVQHLNKSRDATKKQLEDIAKNHSKLVKQFERQQRQIETATATAQAAAAAVAPTPNPNAPHYNIINRTPIRSPSTPSFFNGNMGSHSSMNRYKPHTADNTHHRCHYINEDYIGSSDAYDEVSELSENAAELVKEVQALNELHRSFDKGSICSD